MDEEVSLDSAEEAERLVGWGYKVRLTHLQCAIFLKDGSLKRERWQERMYLKEGSSLQPLRQGRSLTAQLQQNGERFGSDRGATGE